MKSSSFALLVNVRIGFKQQVLMCDISGFFLWGHEHMMHLDKFVLNVETKFTVAYMCVC